MRTPVLIDTDMGVDDAVAITLALSTPQIELVGLASVGGNVGIEQATRNIGRLLGSLGVQDGPAVARGLDQNAGELRDATHLFGADGLGGVDLATPSGFAPTDLFELYEALIGAHGSALAIVTIGPLTNLAAVLRERPGLLERAGRLVIMGGAIWCKGNATPHAEFNFYRDPQAAQAVLASGLPITVVSLDVTSQVAMDESHVAHLACSGAGSGELLARMIRVPMERHPEAGAGKFLPHDALAVGVLLWPELFLRSKMVLEVITSGEQAGRSKPMIGKDKSRQVAVVITVNVGDFLGNLLEQLCHERFAV